MILADITKKIDLYRTAIECLNEIQLLDEKEGKPINSPEEVTPFIIEINLAALRQKEIKKLSNCNNETILESSFNK